MLIQLVGHTICSDNCGTLSSDNVVTGHPSIVSSSMLKKLIQPVSIPLVGCTLYTDTGCTLSSDNGVTGCFSKVTSGKLKKLIHAVLI